MPLSAFALLTDPIIPAGSTTFNAPGNYTVPYGVRVITVEHGIEKGVSIRELAVVKSESHTHSKRGNK